MPGAGGPLRVRWLGRVPYAEALALQEALFAHGREQHLLLLEHPHVFTHGPRADLSRHLLVDPGDVGATLAAVNRGGDITYHGPGQLVGYPILTLAAKHGGTGSGLSDTVAYVRQVEQIVIDALAELGLVGAGRMRQYPGVWIDPDGPRPRKICAIGVRLTRGRTMHGFALNVSTDMRYLREHIVPCGIADLAVTSLAEEGLDVGLEQVADAVVGAAAAHLTEGRIERQDVAWRHRPDDLSPFSAGQGPGRPVRDAGGHTEGVPVRMLGRLATAGVSGGVSIAERKPEWLRPRVRHGAEVLALKQTVRDLGLVTVCEEAGCPNLSECWADGTATFMVLGERCTRACGFCLVDTSRPLPPDGTEPQRVAAAVAGMGIAHAVITMVARDDLPDGGAEHVAATVHAIREQSPGTAVEVLVSDLRGDPAAIGAVVAARPDVYNHNVETVPRLQRAVRPSAGYARSLAGLARAKQAGLRVKSGLVIGLGETDDELVGVLADLASIGCDIVTIGQYLRPTSHHLPVARWVPPETFDRLAAAGEALGIGHVQASPLTRSSYHARQAAAGPSAATVTAAIQRV